MVEKQHQFILPQGVEVSKFKAKLNGLIKLTEEPAMTLQRTFYDTFDWRIHTNNGVLEKESRGRGAWLQWYSLDCSESYGGMRITKPFGFIRDFPHGTLRERLEPMVKMRALLPQVKIQSQIHCLKLLNKDKKTLLRVLIEENILSETGGAGKNKNIPGAGTAKAGPETAGRTLGNFVRVVPVKGYPKPLEKMLQILEREMGLLPGRENLMLKALSALGSRPGEYSSKLNLQLMPATPANEATKTILLRLLNTMMTNEEGTRADVDSEFLHDFRVSVRRTRSALSQIKGVFSQEIIDRFTPQFAWLGRLTGPTRDMDVYLLSLDGYKAQLPASTQNDIDPLAGFLRTRQKKEQKILARELVGLRYTKLIEEWRSYLETPPETHSTLPNARRPISEVASEQIWRMYRRVLKEGKAIKPETPAEVLHDMRKTCKKLRYLMEFFQSIYSKEHIGKLIKALKKFQENLGDIQDLEVQKESLKKFGDEMMKQGKTPASTLMAMGMLIKSLEKHQQQTREIFAVRFGEFSMQENTLLFEMLFAPPPKQEAT
ncbi:MAG: CHAD domain-containing protein [Gammaproteobacteria bacterium]|nr:CHAD domain-containing protein [Gammaproteobacteria bacterium]